ncbi:hypothetical protein [Lacinutrix sp. MedPE-SW]|uniref:type IX secretion system periplasmic lipoprotein PorW/SprE n=1 Tax=Lacinutrix sp. MedPE-SW TaxID=1860087 RepID=UPI000911A8BC|nr:hypothetical protein [Lacinutrix sp. MedPE-SW]OIQ23534.1 MAG: hypothetical protein BM549_02920 [Lacinutrix sp. MedPE-SW]
MTLKIPKKLIVLAVFTALIATSCSRKNDSFLNRSYHAIGAKYNKLYNGNNALAKGQQTLNDGYQDNYWEILPIERMQVTEEITLPGQTKNADFERAEEKAVKAIQKNGMNIQGKERNPQIDEAYLLLGKARYFDQRFIPALEAFNYILYKYPASSNINQAKVWREKTNMRLENDELAIVNLKRLLEEEELEDQDLADVTSTLAQAYINLKSLDSALTQIKIASQETKKAFEKGRYNFIKGQLYNALQEKDSANMAFDEVIDLNRSIPRKYLINAYIEKTKNFDYENGNKLEFQELLTRLEEERENRPFLDKIYHQIAQYHLKTNNDSLATIYYNKSLRTNSPDKILVAKNYETLGDMNFDKNNYKTAGAYYDSTMTRMVLNSKPYRVIKRKRENLDDVIYYEDVAQKNDSILRIVAMPKAERLAYFNNYIAKLKAEAEAEKERIAIETQKAGLATNNAGDTNNSNFIKPASGLPQGSSFYFYNDQTVAYGKNEFTRIWGDRELKDNWRWSSTKSAVAIENASNTFQADVAQDELFDVKTYLDKLPSSDAEIKDIVKERDYAYYQLGLIYKEKFKEYELSKGKFQALLNNKPEERLVLPSKYNLLKMYEILGREAEVNILKNEIITNYPNSRYASILSNPDLALAKDENSPDSVYEAIYSKFENQKFSQVIIETEKNIKAFEGDAIVPKLALLKASAIGRLYGFEQYVKAISNVAIAYANTTEGLQAQMILDKSIENLRNPDFLDDSAATSAKVVYQFTNATPEQLKAYKEIVDKAATKMNYNRLSTSIDIYSPEKTFVVVHGLRSIESAKGFTSLFEEEEQSKLSKPFFGISSENYRILQIHKNLESYLTNQ